MIKRLLYTLPFLLFLFLSCNRHVSEGLNKKERGIRSNADHYGYYYALTKATHDRILGNYAQAIQLLNLCIKYDKESDVAYYQLSIIYYAMGDIDRAVSNAKEAADLDPKNIWYQYQLANIYRKMNNTKGIIEAFSNILVYYPDKINIYFELVNLYMNEKDNGNALATLNKLEDKIGVNENITLVTEQIYSSQGEYDKAIMVMKKFIDNNKHSVKHIGILAELYLIVNNEKEAFEQFNKLFEIDDNNGIAQLSLASYYRQKRNYDSSFVYFAKAIENQSVELDIKIKEIVNFITNPFELKLYDTSIVKLLNILDSSYYEDLKVRTLRADYSIRKEDYKNAQKELTYVVDREVNNYIVWEQLLIVEQRNRDFESLLLHSNKAIESFNTVPQLYYFAGTAYSELDRDTSALKSYFAGIEYIINNNRLKNQFFIQIAESYYKINNYADSDDYFEKSLLLDANNSLVLNNYSYYLSLREENLERAEELCKRLMSLEGNNYAHIDTYAWVLYKMQKYKDALKFIEKAYLQGGANDNVILDHYGDILLKNSLKEDAIKYWELSLLLENSDLIKSKLLKVQNNE